MNKQNNFRWQRRKIFWGLMSIILIEVLLFFFWTVETLTANGIDPKYELNVVLAVLASALILNWIWLWLIDKLFFNADSILSRLYTKRLKLEERKRELQENLNSITNDAGQATHNSTSLEVWEKIPGYTSQNFEQIISKLRKELECVSDRLFFLDDKISFFLQTRRKNLWLYFKSKF